MSDSAKSAADVDAGAAGLPALVARLGEDVLSLVDTKLSLLKIEIEEDLRGYGRSLFAIGVAGVVGAVGFALLNVAVAFVVVDLLREMELRPALQHGLAFGVTGVVYLLVGATLVLRARDRLVRRDPTPSRTVAELKKDKEWLKRESDKESVKE